MLIFKPALWRNGQLFELPRPVVSVRIQDTWDFARFKVPLLDGDDAAGHSRNGVDISLEGQIAAQAGSVLADEAAMLAALEELRDALHVSDPDDRYRLFLYHDAATQTYRSFRDCTTLRFEYDLSQKHLFTYSAVIHAADPTIDHAAAE